MNTSIILEDIKKLLNITDGIDVFDEELLIHINSTISIFGQLWNHNKDVVVDKKTTWEEYIGSVDFTAIRMLIYLTVKLNFDTPSNSFAIEAINKQVLELQYRLMYHGEFIDEEVNKND